MPPVKLTPEILAKYDVAGPRYTSYPTAPEWKDEVKEKEYHKHLEKCGQNDKPLSLYFHIPFCVSLCYYCGCNMAIRKRWPKYGDEYLNALFKEMDQVSKHLGAKKRSSQLHLGGGTPTFLDNTQLQALYEKCDQYFDIDPNGEIAVEIEPRNADPEQIRLLRKLGFNRISMGVQDFDPKVQEAVNRVNTYEEIKDLMALCRELDFKSVNIDLIYGLPYQTKESFALTAEKMNELKPDRIAMYSFAHIPWVKKHQKRIPTEALPSPEHKVQIFLEATRILSEGSFQAIAMDHFALKEDEMALAYSEGKLNRNFMGYTLLPADNFLGFGASSIGYIEGGYFQNHKDLPEYYNHINSNKMPLDKMCILNKDDLLRREIINTLMCRFELDIESFEKEHGISFTKTFAFEQAHLKHCAEDGLLKKDNTKLIVTDLGRLFLRNIAMGFDTYLRKKDGFQRFSRII
ncbi:MAG: oxygen-independent coproporphyrinogen III oxidase [Planctomycetes bacterium]|nr:oxygen-independent coproporphyrinogen III oxidase [Planctomycetota bacterium]